MTEPSREKQRSNRMYFSPAIDLAASCDLTIEKNPISFSLSIKSAGKYRSMQIQTNTIKEKFALESESSSDVLSC